jgi:[methyl-Co(III) methanol-specific corrinoid protein]:coenzyme M methyltransferase
MDRADLFAETGFDALSFDARNSLPELQKMTGKMKLIGCVDNPATLLNGSKRDIIQEVFYSIKNGVSIVAPECSIPLRVSNSNLLAMREAISLYQKMA